MSFELLLYHIHTIKILIDAHALINAQPLFLTLKVTSFWMIFEKFGASIKRPRWPLRRKPILPYSYSMFPNLLLNHRTNNFFFLLVQISHESKGLLALHPTQKFNGFPDLLREYFVLPYWQYKYTASTYFSFLFVNIAKHSPCLPQVYSLI